MVNWRQVPTFFIDYTFLIEGLRCIIINYHYFYTGIPLGYANDKLPRVSRKWKLEGLKSWFCSTNAQSFPSIFRAIW